MPSFFRALRSGWDDLDFEAKFELLIWVTIFAAIVTGAYIVVCHSHDPDPKPPGKTIYLQPY